MHHPPTYPFSITVCPATRVTEAGANPKDRVHHGHVLSLSIHHLIFIYLFQKRQQNGIFVFFKYLHYQMTEIPGEKITLIAV